MRARFIAARVEAQKRAFNQSTRGIMTPETRMAVEKQAEDDMAAIERAAAARALEDAADEIFVPHNENRDMSDAFHRGADAVYDALRARAEAYRQEREEQ